MVQATFSLDTETFRSLFDSSKPIEDVYADYNVPGVGTIELKFFESSYLRAGIEYFRPFIRGFMVLMILFFDWRMLMSFFKQDAGIIAGHYVSTSMKKE